MRSKYFFLTLILWSAIAIAQDQKDSVAKIVSKPAVKNAAYIGVLGGYSYQPYNTRDILPGGDSISLIGLNKSGYNLQFALDAPLWQNWGFCLKVRSQDFKMDEEPLLFQLRRSMPAYSWSMISSSCKFRQVFAGAVYHFPRSGKFNSYARFMGGYGNLTTPGISVQGYRQDTSLRAAVNAAKIRASSFLFGAGFKYEVTNTVYIGLEVDYQFNVFSWPNELLSNNAGVNTKGPAVLKKGIDLRFLPQKLYTGNLSFSIGFILQ